MVLVVGGLVTLYGIARNDLPRSLGGTCLVVTALITVSLATIRRWINDVDNERGRLAEAAHAAQTEAAKYFAAQAGLAAEKARMLRDAEAGRAALAAQLKVEREALQDEFEEQRNTIKCKAFEQGALFERSGALKAQQEPVHERAVVTQMFPHRQPERVRDRGAR
jgi:sensor c-di-GMP phosphodiesterase-like protein